MFLFFFFQIHKRVPSENAPARKNIFSRSDFAAGNAAVGVRDTRAKRHYRATVGITKSASSPSSPRNGGGNSADDNTVVASRLFPAAEKAPPTTIKGTVLAGRRTAGGPEECRGDLSFHRRAAGSSPLAPRRWFGPKVAIQHPHVCACVYASKHVKGMSPIATIRLYTRARV